MTSPAADAAADRPRRRIYTQLWFLVLVAIGLGILFGLVLPDEAAKAKWLADAFIQLIQTITGPVIFVTVVLGIASIGNLARAGGLALRALAYFLAMTLIALTLGLLAGNLIQPGGGFEGQPSAASRADAKAQIDEASDPGLVGFITDDLLPDSVAGPFDYEVVRYGFVSCRLNARLVDRDVLHLRLAPGVVEALEVPVDQRAQGDEELADQPGHLCVELARRGPAQQVEEDEQRGGIEGAARRRGRRGGFPVRARVLSPLGVHRRPSRTRSPASRPRSAHPGPRSPTAPAAG
jgi:type IV secretory pathway VirB2 component (pilin)